MQQRENLTNEGLKGLYKSSFDLTNYAIRLARYYVKSGHEISVDSLLGQVRRNPHEDLEALEEQIEEIQEKEQSSPPPRK